uniref:Uncharacterized protein n=1 Tax=viral metagenome TaxID=1070528 RepID=A0A6C0C1T7_9ZZZZ
MQQNPNFLAQALLYSDDENEDEKIDIYEIDTNREKCEKCEKYIYCIFTLLITVIIVFVVVTNT